MADDAFLARWSRRKALAREGAIEPPPAVAPAPAPATAERGPAPEPEPDPPPTMDDVARLTRDSDYAPFVARRVDADVRNAALKKLFADPHFNVMDGLDTYIADYNTPDPLPPGMLRQMVQARLLGLLQDDPDAKPRAADPAAPDEAIATHEDPAVQLQPDDDAGRAGDRPRAGADPAGVP